MKHAHKKSAAPHFDLDAYGTAMLDFVACTTEGRKPGAKTRKALAEAQTFLNEAEKTLSAIFRKPPGDAMLAFLNCAAPGKKTRQQRRLLSLANKALKPVFG